MSAATTSHPAPSLHRRALRNLTTLAAPLMLLACGTDPEPVPPGDTGSVDVAIDATDTTVDADTDAGPDVLHDVPPDVIPVSPCGPRPEVACQTLGCGDGEVCAWAPDACYASVCTCDEGSREWACISEDCRPGWACTPDPGCDGPDPSLTCRQTGCAPGFACVDVPGGCVPSSCSCGDDGTWVCTEDCGSAAACEPVEGACPAEPAINEACTDEGVSCAWGEECCCGTCSPSLVCTCASGSWACYATDACFIPSCEGRPCSADSDCEGGSPRGVALECVNGMCMDRGAPRDCAQHDTVDASTTPSTRATAARLAARGSRRRSARATRRPHSRRAAATPTSCATTTPTAR